PPLLHCDHQQHPPKWKRKPARRWCRNRKCPPDRRNGCPRAGLLPRPPCLPPATRGLATTAALAEFRPIPAGAVVHRAPVRSAGSPAASHRTVPASPSPARTPDIPSNVAPPRPWLALPARPTNTVAPNIPLLCTSLDHSSSAGSGCPYRRRIARLLEF